MSLGATEANENVRSGIGGAKAGATLESIPWKCLVWGREKGRQLGTEALKLTAVSSPRA
jgi:hypothetical protein